MIKKADEIEKLAKSMKNQKKGVIIEVLEIEG